MPDRYLSIYLNDHLAVIVGIRELLERTLENNTDSPFGELLTRLLEDSQQERRALAALMRDHGIPENHLKTSGAWLAERIGRLKMNGQLTGYSPLSRLVEIEGIALGLDAKRIFWDNLSHIGVVQAGGFVTKSLARRAEQRLEELDEHRRDAAKEALGFRAPSLTEL